MFGPGLTLPNDQLKGEAVPSAHWTNALQVFTYDVIEEGPDQVLSGTKLAGANTIVLLVSSDEHSPIATPHNPRRSTNWGRSCFPPTTSRYPAALIPEVSDEPESNGRAAYHALRAVAEPGGVRLAPWMQLLWRPAGADNRNRTVNVRGEFVREWLCPNGPDTLAYAAALSRDCVEQFQASALFIDMIRFPQFGTGAPGSVADACTCFCDGCFDRARSEGVDLEKTRHLLLGWLDLLEKEPSAAAEFAFDAASSVVMGVRAASDRPAFLDWLKFRHRTITRLVERIRGSIPDKTELWLDTWPATGAWLLGQDLQELAPYATWVKTFFYPQLNLVRGRGLIQSWSADTRTRQVFYEAYLKLLGRKGPPEFEQYATRGMYPGTITSEMALAKGMLGGRSRLAAGVGIWDSGPDGVRETLAHAAAAEPDGVWMHCYAWATMDELEAAGEWLREHGRTAPAGV